MTTVAWDGRIMAADRRALDNGTITVMRKIARAKDYLGRQCMMGTSGDAVFAVLMENWFMCGMEPKQFPCDAAVDKDGEIRAMAMVAIRGESGINIFTSHGYPLHYEAPFHALGSGRPFAIAAMHLGCDAEKAVEVASLYDDGTGNGIDVLRWED